MGGNQTTSEYGLNAGEGFRIISVKKNSPLDGRVDVFFDFITDIHPLQPIPVKYKNPIQILDKLTNEKETKNIMDELEKC